MEVVFPVVLSGVHDGVVGIDDDDEPGGVCVEMQMADHSGEHLRHGWPAARAERGRDEAHVLAEYGFDEHTDDELIRR